MAMVDMQDLLAHAYRNRYAVGAFEVVNLDFLRAIIEAAELTVRQLRDNLALGEIPYLRLC